MTKKEQQRAHVLTRVQAGILTAETAAELGALSVRHFRRLLAEVRQKGLAALAHGNRGRASTRRLSDIIRARILTLARTTYAGANDHHLTEWLREREALRLSRPTVRRLLREAGIGSPRTRRPPRPRRRRERMPQAGLLVQMDGSQHPWLEDRGPRLVLHAAIDDATGTVLGGVFRLEEDTQGYCRSLRQLIRRYGVPTSAYTDRHGIFHRDPRTPRTLDEQLQGTVESTQVGRALQELGIRWIPLGRLKRRVGLSGSLGPSRTAWWSSSAWPAPARSRRRSASSIGFSLAPMPASPRPPRAALQERRQCPCRAEEFDPCAQALGLGPL